MNNKTPLIKETNSDLNLEEVVSYYQPYFLQFDDWTDFWKNVNGQPHDIFTFQVSDGEFALSTKVYQYPWYFGQKFWYIAKGGVLSHNNFIVGDQNMWNNIAKDDLQKLFWKLNDEIVNQANKQSICYIKADWEQGLSDRIGIDNDKDWLKYYNTKYPKSKQSNKIIQYLQTMTLDLGLIPDGPKFDLNKLSEFYDYSKPLWNKTNSNVKRYTKKSLTLGWDISINKTDQNFEAFWQVYSATKDRQAFTTQTKAYTRMLFDKDFSRIIILRNSLAEPCCVWQGVVFGDTFVYLSGGNNQYSFDNSGQYLMHLVAVWMGYTEGLRVYDLGGYDKSKGFGRFKENYKGQIRTFLGDIDIPVLGFKFKAIDGVIELVKKIKSK